VGSLDIPYFTLDYHPLSGEDIYITEKQRGGCPPDAGVELATTLSEVWVGSIVCRCSWHPHLPASLRSTTTLRSPMLRYRQVALLPSSTTLGYSKALASSAL